MSDEFPADLIRLIHACIPTYQAAEVLLFFAAHPERGFTAADVVVSMRPVVVTVPAMKEYLDGFVSCGLVDDTNGVFTYAPVSTELEQSISELAHAYNERPVTLINVIYRMADSSIRSFADAFNLRKE